MRWLRNPIKDSASVFFQYTTLPFEWPSRASRTLGFPGGGVGQRQKHLSHLPTGWTWSDFNSRCLHSSRVRCGGPTDCFAQNRAGKDKRFATFKHGRPRGFKPRGFTTTSARATADESVSMLLLSDEVLHAASILRMNDEDDMQNFHMMNDSDRITLEAFMKQYSALGTPSYADSVVSTTEAWASVSQLYSIQYHEL